MTPARQAQDPRLARLSEICLALPETRRERSGHSSEHAGFLVGSKKFAWFLDDHHGDGRAALSVRVGRGVNEDLIAEAPDRFYRAKYMHHHGWVCLRLDTGRLDWDEVSMLVANSYRMQAPKRLATLLAPPA